MAETSSNSDERKALVQDYFSRTAESYVTSTSHRSGKDLSRLLEIGAWNPHQQALDIATGGGHTALAVAPHVGQIIVTDLTPTMLETARAFILAQGVTNAQFQLADAEDLPFADASFERVTCRIAPHHFPHVAKFVQEVARVLKPGGLFLLIDNIAPADTDLDAFINTVEKWRDPSHGRSCTVNEWLGFFQQAGLQAEYTEIFWKTYQFADWTARAQMSESEKARLEQFILAASEKVRSYFAVTVNPENRLVSLNAESVLLKGCK